MGMSHLQRISARAVLLAALGVATATAQTSIPLPGDRAFPENIAASHDGTIFIGSLGSGGVYRVAPHSKEAKVWIEPGALGTHSIFGVLADEKSNTLWVCSNDLTTSPGIIVGGSDGVSALKGFDLKTGKGKVSVALAGKPALCNDITIGPDGGAYVTNTLAPQVLRLAPGARKLEVWFTDPALQPASGAGLDGLVAVAGKTAWVSEGQLSYAFDPSKKSQTPNLPFHIYPVDLPAAH